MTYEKFISQIAPGSLRSLTAKLVETGLLTIWLVLQSLFISTHATASSSIFGPSILDSTVLDSPQGGPLAWGDNSFGQLGDGTYGTDRLTPVPVSGLTGAIAITASYGHSLALKEDETIWAWGYNSHGELGVGDQNPRSTPVQVNGLTKMMAIAAGDLHSLAIKADGTVWAWGYNGQGQLGVGDQNPRLTPVLVGGLTRVIAIAAGNYHSLAIKADGTVWAWGYNGNGQLGDGSSGNTRLTPVLVSGLTDVRAIAAFRGHSLALRADGTVWAWGSNYFGQLGDGTTTDRLAPVKVSGLTRVTAIATGYGHSLALRANGTVWAWGYNDQGQLGLGDQNSRYTPGQVSGLTGVKAIAAGKFHSLALMAYGTVWTWGANSDGQLGDGTSGNNRLTPMPVSGLTPVKAIAAGHSHSLALASY